MAINGMPTMRTQSLICPSSSPSFVATIAANVYNFAWILSLVAIKTNPLFILFLPVFQDGSGSGFNVFNTKF